MCLHINGAKYSIAITVKAADQGPISQIELSFMFVSIFLHKLAHSSLVWYGAGSCNSLNLNGSNGKSGEIMEKALFGGILSCEIDMNNFVVNRVGLVTEGNFYPISELKFRIQNSNRLHTKDSLLT